ncbi:SapC family protein [Peristeroidobacter agariperforans]|uniref:SapC family protein n=1 Tax=Peristeroidobacter agariperforans TaxID=268404 RepID=UPI00101DEA65|nr:SapC family protein [Peristeroidobacter agariperforans]
MRLVELSRSEHRELRIRGDRVEASAAHQHLIPIVVGEFRKAATQYPIVFAKHPETGRFAPYVLSGLGVAENLFWSGTELDVAYVPLNVRRQPFYVRMDDAPDASAANVLCIDLDHPCLDPSGTRTIVNADGSDSAYLKEILAILGELVAGRTATEQFIAALLSLDLLAPIMLDIVLEDATPLQLQGLYGLDEERFRQLDAAQIASLWQSGYLDLIYAVMIASGQIFKLIRLKNQRIALSRAWQGNAS